MFHAQYPPKIEEIMDPKYLGKLSHWCFHLIAIIYILTDFTASINQYRLLFITAIFSSYICSLVVTLRRVLCPFG